MYGVKQHRGPRCIPSKGTGLHFDFDSPSVRAKPRRWQAGDGKRATAGGRRQAGGGGLIIITTTIIIIIIIIIPPPGTQDVGSCASRFNKSTNFLKHTTKLEDCSVKIRRACSSRCIPIHPSTSLRKAHRFAPEKQDFE